MKKEAEKTAQNEKHKCQPSIRAADLWIEWFIAFHSGRWTICLRFPSVWMWYLFHFRYHYITTTNRQVERSFEFIRWDSTSLFVFIFFFPLLFSLLLLVNAAKARWFSLFLIWDDSFIVTFPLDMRFHWLVGQLDSLVWHIFFFSVVVLFWFCCFSRPSKAIPLNLAVVFETFVLLFYYVPGVIVVASAIIWMTFFYCPNLIPPALLVISIKQYLLSLNLTVRFFLPLLIILVLTLGSSSRWIQILFISSSNNPVVFIFFVSLSFHFFLCVCASFLIAPIWHKRINIPFSFLDFLCSTYMCVIFFY